MEAKPKRMTVFQVVGAIALILHVAALTIIFSGVNQVQSATFLEHLGPYLFLSLLIVSTISMFCITLGVKNRFSIPSLVIFFLLYIGAETLPSSPSQLTSSNSQVAMYVIAFALLSSLMVNGIDMLVSFNKQ